MTTINAREVKSEKLGFRDERISQWHRNELGFDCPATDIDFLLLEYDRAIPRAVIEYKHKNQKPISRRNPTILALSTLCDRAGLPFFLVRYTDDCEMFRVTPVNDRAKRFTKQTTLMSSEVFKRFHLRLRNR